MWITQYESAKHGRLWKANWRGYDGTQHGKRGFKLKSEATAYARAQETAVDTGEFVAPNKLTVADVTETWISSIQHSNRKPATISSYTSAAHNWVAGDIWPRTSTRRRHAIGSLPLSALSEKGGVQLVQNWLNEIASQRSASTVNDAKVVAGLIFKQAIVNRHLQGANPVSLIETPRARVESKPKVFLTRVQTAALVANAHKYEGTLNFPGLGLIVETLAVTGMRFGELAALHGSDLDVENRALLVSRNLDDNKRRGTTKRGKARRVAISESLATRLGEHLSSFDGALFRGPKGGYLVRRNLLRRQWRELVEATPELADVEGAVVFHSLRHSHASHLAQDGWTAKRVSDRLGHASVRITLDVYTHLFKDDTTEEELAGLDLYRPDLKEVAA